MTSPRISPSDVAVSDELRAPVSTDVELCYQTYGDPGDDPLLLVMGLSAPMTWWNDRLCRMLAADGFYVVRFDNRDTGRSGRAPGRVTRPDLVQAFLGLPGKPPYQLSTMADDAVGLLDHLDIDKAHVVGASMGGMIVQTLVVEHPDRVASMVSIMSTTGRRTVGWLHPAVLARMLVAPAQDRDAYIQRSLMMGRLIGSPAYPDDPDEVTTRAGETFDRGISPSGAFRQMAAILRQPDRTRALHAVRVPTAVIHGTADKMVHISGGRATAAAIPGAELVVIDGMGHDLPSELYSTYVEVIRRTADRARS